MSPSKPKTATQLLRDRAHAPASDATLAEVFCDSVTDGAPVGFTVAHLQNTTKPVLWIQDRLSRRETGRPYLAGLPTPLDLIYVDVSRPVDLLWAMEEGLRCPDLGGVIGEIWGDPPALDFTATKRLALRAEAHRVPAWLIRRAGSANLSAARLRWRIKGLPSLNDPYDAQAPGQAQWEVELFRARWQTPGTWVAHHDADGLHFDHGLDGHVPHDKHAYG
ncbi:MAG: protein ImuA [Yoonia sp.]|jgi:protein ImuA